MKFATLATMCFAAAFAIEVAPSQTGKIHTASSGVQNVNGTHLDTDYLLTEPDLMLVPYDAGILKA